MTSGELLKQKLKISNFPYTRIRRVVTGGSLRTYQIVYDSRMPSRPLTSTMLNSNILAPKLVSGDAEKFMHMPWANLSTFNGALELAIFFVTDVAGFYGRPQNYSEKIFKVKESKLEELTIPELRNVDALTSTVTQKYKDIRKQFQGKANTNTKFLGTEFIKETGSIRFKFLTESTEIGKDKKSHSMTTAKVDIKKQFNKDSDSMEDNPSKTYDMDIQLENVVPNDFYTDISWLEVYKGEVVSQKMVKELLEVADVKLHDTTPAFQYQGFRYRLTTQDAAINPESRPDAVWRAKHGSQGLLDKHFSQLLDKGSFDMFLNNMTSSFFNKLKQLGYVDPKTRIVL